MKTSDEIRREEETPQVRIINPEIDKEMFDAMRAEDHLSDGVKAIADEAERVTTELETWLLREDNEYITSTRVTSSLTLKHINVQAVIDFLHDRIEIPKG